MFGKLKEKLKSFFTKSKEKAEKQVEETEKVEEKLDKTLEKVEEKTIETATRPGKERKKGMIKKLTSKFKFKVTEQYFEEIFSDLELVLLENNVALEVVEKLKKDLKQELVGLEIKKEDVGEKIKEALRISLESLFPEPLDLIKEVKEKEGPYTILFFGINGSGKTTTIAKICNLLIKNNLSCVLAASDTFRAASIEQLEKHAEKLKVKVIKSQYKADPASVAFDAIAYAKKHNIKAVLIDTAGRMYTKSDLMKEMEKISRISKPDLKIFVAEAITGNDATEQAQTFNNTVGIDAIVLTKADVDDRGGATISVSYVTGKPILYLGTGQNYEELKVFKPENLIGSLGL